MLKSSLISCSHAGEICLACLFSQPCLNCRVCARPISDSPDPGPASPFSCPQCQAKLRRPARRESPCPTCCHPFDYTSALRRLEERRGEIREAFGIETFSPILIRLDIDDTLGILAGEAQWATSLEHVSERFIVFEIVNDAVIFSFDETPIEDLSDLRRRLGKEG